jgi:hypothetical protein
MTKLLRVTAIAVLTLPSVLIRAGFEPSTRRPAARIAERDTSDVLQDWLSAAGDASALEQLKSLTTRLAITRFNATNSGGTLAWHGQLWLLPPSRYLKTESDDRELGMGRPRGHGVNGEEIVMVNGPDPKGLTVPVRDGLYRSDVTRLRWMSILLLHAKPESVGATLKYLGDVNIDDQPAELLEMTPGPGSEHFGLGFDKKTHKPIGIGTLSTDSQGHHRVTLNVRLTEFKQSSKVLLPFKYQYFLNGAVTEEWSVDSYELNPRAAPPELK